MGSESINKMFQTHLLEEGHLHYGEFMNDLSRLIVSLVLLLSLNDFNGLPVDFAGANKIFRSEHK